MNRFTADAASDRSSNQSSHRSDNPTCRLSFVIPVMNEEETLGELVAGIRHNAGPNAEIIFIDDGSTDTSWEVIERLVGEFPDTIRGIRFRNNRGKADALQVGFDAAGGEIIFTMDADLQDDPNEIPRFLAKLDEGYDLVSGWKAVRHDPWHKVLPSRVFNRMLSRMSRVKLHDHNCGFKCYRRHVAKSIRLFGELHRMVPALSGMGGYKVTEIVVTHHARRCGVSKYGIERFIRGFSDMLTMGFMRVYRHRPSHFANALATMNVAAAGVVGLAGVVSGSWFAGLAAAAILGSSAAACVTLGLLAELVIRTRHPLDRPDIVVDTGVTLAAEMEDRKTLAVFNRGIETETAEPVLN